MNSRRKFLKTSAFASIAIISAPSLALSTSTNRYSNRYLIGKSTPALYGKGYRLLKRAHEAFLDMDSAARKHGMRIRVVSSYRSFYHQNLIWTRKYNRYRSRKLSPKTAVEYNIRYTAIPGSSRHHWGTEIDVVDGSIKTSRYPLNTKNFHGYGIYKNFREWMDENAYKYGYFRVYTNDHTRRGFKYEPWHYSFAELAKPMLKEYTERDVQNILKEQELLGKKYFTETFIKQYTKDNILGINKNLLV
ncbi:MAG TPA: D-alanyl-D-alanine carboxypeptidase family protein [Flavobacteriia bacterium]|nr:D-alanyl-D-alanine carboxypeptidase family protein [Flavobacteriia bacterium]